MHLGHVHTICIHAQASCLFIFSSTEVATVGKGLLNGIAENEDKK